MKKYVFGKAEVNISLAAFKRGVNALISSPKSSRKSLAAAAAINESYAGKILVAMEKCKLINQISSTLPLFYSLSKNIVTAVLFIEPSRFSFSVLNECCDCLFFASEHIPPDLSFSDNLYSFLSRSGLSIKERTLTISSIGVILNKKDDNMSRLIDGIFADVFGMLPLLYASRSEAVSAVFDFKLVPDIQDKNAAYIRLSDDILAFYRNQRGEVLPCDVSRLPYDGNLSLLSAYENSYSASDAGEIVARIMSAMDFFGKIDTCIIESDRFKVDPYFTEAVRRTYATTGHMPPEIYSSSAPSGYLISAAAKLLCAELILSLIKTN